MNKKTIRTTESSASSAGYKYQDIVAFEKVVELLLDDNLKQVTIDMSNVPHIEDVVLEYKDNIEYIQIKHSNSDKTATFIKSDVFSNEKSLFSKTFHGWKTQKNKGNIRVTILTNDKVSITKSKGSSLYDIVQAIENYRITNKIEKSFIKIMVEDLKINNQSHINQKEIKLFLQDLYFSFEYSSKYELLDEIKMKLKKLIQTDNIDSHFDKLYGIVSMSATENSESKRTFTKESLERLLDIDNSPKFTHFYDIPKEYVDVTENYTNLQTAYNELNSGYIFLKGQAGSGKTTFITKFLSKEYEENDIAVLRYYLFHFDDSLNEDASNRVKKNFFYYDLSNQLKKYLDDDFKGSKYLSEQGDNYKIFWDNLELLTKKYKKVIVVVDGIDHAIRAKENIDTFFEGIKNPNEIINNVVFILSGQANWDKYPSWLKGKSKSNFKTIEIEPFNLLLCKKYIENTSYFENINLIDYISDKAYNLTHGYPLNLQVFLKNIQHLKSKEEIDNFLDSEYSFQDLNIYYGKLFDSIKKAYFQSNEKEFLRFQALLYLLKEPISSEIVESIFEIDIFDFDIIIDKILPILKKVENGSYTLFHNDIRVYLSEKIRENVKQHTIKKIADYYLVNIESDYSQLYLMEYLDYLEDFKQIKKILNFDRLDLKYRLLRDTEEIEAELQIGLKVAKKLKDPIFMLQVLLLEKQHEMVLENLMATEFDGFNISPKIENNLYSYIAPSKDDISWQAMNKREEFYQAFINLKIESQETKKYFFNKFSFDIVKYVKSKDANSLLSSDKKVFFEQYFLIYLDIDKDSAILGLKELQKIEEKNIDYVSQYFFNTYMKLYLLNLEEIRMFQNLEIIIPKKIISNLVYNLYESNKTKELKELLIRLIEMNFLNDDIIYLALINGWKDYVPLEYTIKPLQSNDLFQFQKEREKLFKWAYLETYQKKLQSPFVLFDSLYKSEYSDYNENKTIIWLGYLSIKENLYESDIEQCFQFILTQEWFGFSKIYLFMDKFLFLIEESKRVFALNKLTKIYNRFSEYDEFVFYFYKWCAKYSVENEKFSFKKLEEELKIKIHGLNNSERINRISTLIKIRKYLNQNYDDYLYLIRKFALSYGYRKDYQSEIFMEYFKNILIKDYPKYIDVIYKYLYVEQFKQNEYTEKTTTLEEVLEEILKVVYLNSKSDLFNILEYFFQDEKYDKKRLEIPSKLFLTILPNLINTQEEALLSYSFLKMGTTFSLYNYITENDEKKVKYNTSELKKFNIDYIDTFKNNVVEKEDPRTFKVYEKASEKEFISFLEEQQNTESFDFQKSGDINYNIRYHADVFFEKKCEENTQEMTLPDLLKSVCYMKDIDLDGVNKLTLQYLENLYSNVSEDIDLIDKKYNDFNISILLEFLKKYFFSINERTVVSAIQSYIKIGEFYIDETIDFIIDCIDYNNPFHTKIWLDILVELPLSRYNNIKKLENDLIELFHKSKYVYLDYSFKKIFSVLDITTLKKYNYSTLQLPSNIIIETEKESNSYQKFYSNSEYQTTEMFIRKLIKITGLEENILWDKINYFHYTKNISINYYQNCAEATRLLNFHSPFFEAEFVEWLYQENLLNIEQYNYLLQILQSYDLKVLKQENYKPDYIKQLPFMDYKEKNIDKYLEKLEINQILSDSSKIFSAHWEEFLNNNYIASFDLNTVVINKELISELKGNEKILEQFYFNFGVDSFYIEDNNIYYKTVDNFFKTELPIETSTQCFNSLIFHNSQLMNIVPPNIQTKLIKWDYGAINTDRTSELSYLGCGQIHELANEIEISSDEIIIKFCRVNIHHEKEDESGSKFFVL